MTEHADSLERWRFAPDGGDWDDVPRRARRSRPPLGRVLLVAAAALLLAVPAFALVGATPQAKLPPGPRLSAQLSKDVRVEMSAPRTLLVRRAGGVVAPVTLGRLRGERRPRTRFLGAWKTTFVWRLAGSADASALELRGRGGAVLERMCAPCAAHASASFRVGRGTATAVFNRRTSVALVLDDRTLTAPLVPERRRR
jgi:hypothetical protein